MRRSLWKPQRREDEFQNVLYSFEEEQEVRRIIANKLDDAADRPIALKVDALFVSPASLVNIRRIRCVEYFGLSARNLVFIASRRGWNQPFPCIYVLTRRDESAPELRP